MILRASSQEEPSPVPFCRRRLDPAFSHKGEGEVAPEDLSIKLPASVALILRLVTDAKGVTPDEAIARGICIYAEHIGIPTLARDFDDRAAGETDFREGGP